MYNNYWVKNLLKKLDIIFTSYEVKKHYISKGMNPKSANYWLRNKQKNGDIIKIQNGLFFKKNYKLNDENINLFFKEKNNNEYKLYRNIDMDNLRITNAIFSKSFIIVKSRFYNNNILLFNFLKKEFNIEIIIITSQGYNVPSVDEHSKVYITIFTNIEDKEYLYNAFNLIKDISRIKLNKIIRNLRLNISEQNLIEKIYENK